MQSPKDLAYPEYYNLERDGKVLGSYSFDNLVTMWRTKELRLTDRIRKHNKNQWIEVSKIVHALERADRTINALVSRTNLIVGTASLLIGLGIFLWARDRSLDRSIYTYPNILNGAILVSALFGIVGLIKVIRGTQ